MKNFSPLASLSFFAFAAASQAQLYSENFDVDHTANWTVNGGPSDESANFFFDYSTYGIPSAPGSGGTTRGLRLLANQTNNVFGGLSVSPIGQSFSGDYTLRADVWLNFVGPAPVGGSGSTQVGGLGIGTSGTFANWPGFADSVYFMTTTDGNSATDWRAYSSAQVASYTEASGVYFAGNVAGVRNSSHPYYSGFGGVTPPAAQTGLFPNQTGSSLAGCIAFGWHEMEVVKVGNTVTWLVDDLPIAAVNISSVTLGGGNILLNYSDTNATSSTDPNDFLNTAIFDNVQVLRPVPEPGTMAVLGFGALALIRRRKQSK